MEQRARHGGDYNRLDDWTQATGQFPVGPGSPPIFPTRDVTLTYRNLYRPGVVLRAYYQASAWRMRVEVVSGADSNEAAELDDAFARSSTTVWDATREYAVRQTGWEDRFGKVYRGVRAMFEVQGTDVVAGVPCTRYTVRDSTGIVAQVCLTEYGVPLRREDRFGATEALNVEYGPVEPSRVTLPDPYRPRPSR